MIFVLTVTNVHELGDNWMAYPENYETLTGYSCLTPEGIVFHIKQYAIDLTDGTDKYTFYSVSYDDMSEFSFELTDGIIHHVPYIGEVLKFNCHLGALPKSDKPLRLTSNKWCCLLTEDGMDHYCYMVHEDKPFTEVYPVLVLKEPENAV